MDRNLEQVLRALGAEVGLPDLQLDDDGYCCLVFDDLQVHIESLDETQHVLLHTCLGRVPAAVDASFYARLLHANHFFAQTAGATIGVHPESGSIDMALVLACAHLSEQAFAGALQSFVNAAEWWLRELARGDTTEAVTPSADTGHVAQVPSWLHQRA